MTENAIAKEIVDAAFCIHTTLGPGLLESVYHTVLVPSLKKDWKRHSLFISFECQISSDARSAART